MKQHMKKWWKHWVVILSLIAAVLSIVSSFYGWLTPKEEIKPGYICPDGTIVSVPENCPICNEDGICQDKEKCDCEDCEDTVPCVIERVGEGEYLLLLNEPTLIPGTGKSVTAKEITTKGSVTIEVEGEIREIPTTRQETAIKGLKVTTQEIIYNYAKPSKSMVIVKVEKV